MTEFNPRCSESVIIDDLDIRRARTRPLETDAVSIVDSNAVLAFAISTQRFQPIARRPTLSAGISELRQFRQSADRKHFVRVERFNV